MEAKLPDHVKLARPHKEHDSVKKAETAAIAVKDAANTKWQDAATALKEAQKRFREIRV